MKKTPSRGRLADSPTRLASYLAAGVAAGLLGTPHAEAAIVTINITDTGFNIDGVNAGLSNSQLTRFDFPISGGGILRIRSNNGNYGLYGVPGQSPPLSFAVGSDKATPTKFTLNQSIGSSARWQQSSEKQLFRSEYYYGTYTSPDFGPGSYMGFKTKQGNYGWLEVTWTSATKKFQIYSGAYESTVGTAIAAGATAAVPEPSTIALLVLGAAGLALNRRQAKKRQAAAS